MIAHNKPNVKRQWVETREAAAILGMPLQAVQRYCRLGLISTKRIGQKYRINLADITKYQGQNDCQNGREGGE